MRREWRAAAALVLAFGAATAIILLVVETMLHVGAITAQESTVLSTSLGAMIGAVATYLGGARPDDHGASPAGSPDLSRDTPPAPRSPAPGPATEGEDGGDTRPSEAS